MVDIIGLMQSLVLYRNHEEGSSVYFGQVSGWTLLCRNYLFTVQTLLGDSVVVSFRCIQIMASWLMSILQLYRCYVVWQSKLVMVLPVLLWCSVGGTGAVVLGVD